MIKKIFIISTIVFVLAGLALFAYKYLNKNSLTKQENGISSETQNKKEEAKKEIKEEKKQQEQKKIKKIAEGDIKGVALNEEKNKIYYFNRDNFLVSDLDGTSKKTINTHPFEDVQFFSWAEKFDKALIKSKGKFFIYDLNLKKVTSLKDGVDVAIWNYLRDRVVYKYFDHKTKKRSLNIADISGENWKKIMDISYQKVNLNMKPKSEKAGVYPVPDAFITSELTSVDLISGEQVKIFEGKKGADYLWSPNGKNILVSNTLEGDKSKLNLGVMNGNGGEYRGLNFPTSTRKCVWSKDNINIFCASMNGVSSHFVLPNDWENKKIDSIADTFWKINTQNAEKNRIIETKEIEEFFDGENFFLDDEEEYLFFTNRKNGDLYRIKIEIEELDNKN